MFAQVVRLQVQPGKTDEAIAIFKDSVMPAAQQQRADGDIQTDVSVVAEPADSAAIRAAPDGFEFIDDLHGPDLGSAGHRSPGEGRPEQLAICHPRTQGAGHLPHAMMHGGMRFDGPRLGNPHRAILADAAKIVAHQVDDHVEFGKLLAPGRVIFIKPGWGMDNSEATDRESTLEVGFRWFF